MTGLAGVVDPISDAANGVAQGAAEAAAASLLRTASDWILEGVVWTVRAVFSFFDTATSPNLASAWFSGNGGPYAMTVQLAGLLLVGFALVAVTQGVLAGDVGGMIRNALVRVPAGVLAMVATVGVTQAAIAATDAVSAGFLARFADDGEQLAHMLQRVTPADGLTPPFAVVLVGLVAVIAGLVVIAELVVRSALIYVVVALAPFVFAAQVWPVLAGAARRVLEMLAALVLSKLAIAVALSVAGAAVTSTASTTRGAATAATASAASAGGGASAAEMVGVLLAAAAAFGVAAFSPVLIHRLIPLTEAAAVSHGTTGGPMRAGRSVLATTNSAAAASHRLGLLAGAGGAAAAGATAAAGGAAPSPAAAAGGAVRVVGRGTARATAPIADAGDGSREA